MRSKSWGLRYTRKKKEGREEGGAGLCDGGNRERGAPCLKVKTVNNEGTETDEGEYTPPHAMPRHAKKIMMA